MATTSAVVLAGEIGKALLQLAFEYMRQSGMTAEEAERAYLDARLKFLNNKPTNIPDV